MSLELYPHNRQAYDAALTLLKKNGKAAVIHPTGTGKSYIGFELAWEHPGDQVLWLTPSEYIVKTQLENLFRSSGWKPGNIFFLTYAKLMTLSDQELAELRPDWIVLDEFHRCGAEKWGEGVSRLLSAWPGVPMLGLSATNVRYLDNQRDMASELFEGSIASQMTLGEAIVRGILPAPVYVASVYGYQKELESWQGRLQKLKDPNRQNQGEKYLEALRRALEKSQGLQGVFARHMPNRSGKYLCFCSGRQQMEEMIRAGKEWFSAVDPAPHSYRVYSEDPDAGGDFRAFKEDTSSHLKLLYCIDMLNEGIHVSGIDGIIMFRPTVSPIIYKQQLGRALAAGSKRTPVVFDVVNNFESLYSIGAIQEEMQTAVQHLYREGRGSEIVTEQFRIREEVQGWRELFEKLGESLSPGWERYYQAACRYRRENGDLRIPKRYKTEDGLSLGAWLAAQRAVRSGRAEGHLSEEQIRRLDALGMEWENRLEQAFERGYARASLYYQEHGDLNVPARYVTEDGFALGRWITNCRQQKTAGGGILTPERVRRLEEIGMIWKPFSLRWEQNYLAAARYYAEKGNLEVPPEYVDGEGMALGRWVAKQRALYTGTAQGAALSPEQIARLEEIGMRWESSADRQWVKNYGAARQYYLQHGNLKLPAAYKTPDGIALGKWVRRQQYALSNPQKSNCRLTPERVKGLAEIGIA